jgi:hypothetical protein
MGVWQQHRIRHWVRDNAGQESNARVVIEKKEKKANKELRGS